MVRLTIKAFKSGSLGISSWKDVKWQFYLGLQYSFLFFPMYLKIFSVLKFIGIKLFIVLYTLSSKFIMYMWVPVYILNIVSFCLISLTSIIQMILLLFKKNLFLMTCTCIFLYHLFLLLITYFLLLALKLFCCSFSNFSVGCLAHYFSTFLLF